jgi:transposase-like protein
MAIDLEKLKPKEYDDLACSYESEAVCPYCGHKNYVEAEDYGGQDDWQEDYCGNCERHFVRQTNYTIEFNTKPLENYIIDEIRNLKRNLKYAEERLLKEDTQYYRQYVEIHRSQLKIAIDKYTKMLEENEECN